MKFSNVHTHTNFSDGKNTPEEMLLAAIDKGFVSYGFSDHSHTDCDLSYCMQTKSYPKYFAEINRLKEKYKGKIDVLLGMELDYYSEVDRKKLDYIISSVHYMIENGKVFAIDHAKDIQEDCIENVFGADKNAFAEKYYEYVKQNVKKNKPDIVGHFDVITKYGVIDEDDKEYQKIALDAIDEVLKYCNVIEMNTGAIFRKCKTTPYPAPFILKRILEKGGKVMINGDSHQTEAIDTFFEESVEILKKVGFEEYLILTSNGFESVKI